MDQLVQGDPASTVSRLTKIMFLCQLNPTTRLQLVATSDVGAVAALALQHPNKYIGRTVDIAGDELTPRDLEDGWREVFGVEMRPEMVGGSALSWVVRTATKDLRLMFKVCFLHFGVAFRAYMICSFSTRLDIMSTLRQYARCIRI